MKKKRPTLEDVARIAGVSRQTVSRVMNGRPLVSADAHERVMAAIQSVKYRPDPIARSLATRKTYLIGVLTTSFSRYNPARAIEGAEEHLRARGYQTFVTRCETDETMEPLRAPLVHRQPVEGILIVSQDFVNRRVDILDDLNEDLPIVTTGFGSGHSRITAISPPDFQGGYKVGELFVRRGRRNLAMITGPQRDYSADRRTEGFMKALSDNGVDPNSCLVRHADWSYEQGYAAAKELIANHRQIEGIFAHNDPIAIGVIRAGNEAGLSVPEDIAVAGFDDIPLASYVSPSLTTVRNPAYEQGTIAARVLLALIEEHHEDERLTREDAKMLEPKLIVRESCP